MANCTEEAGTENASGLPQELCTLAPSDLMEGSNLEPSRVDPLIHSHPTVAYVYIAIMAAALMIGSGGNVLILLVIGTLRNFQRTGKMFIVNLALADICVAAIADPMCLIAVVKGESWFDDKKWLCEAVATICLTACFCAFLSLTLASLNRFVFICHNAVYDKVFTAKTSIAACVLVWIAAFSFEAPNFLGWGDHFFDPKSHQCIWDRTASFSYTMFVSVGLILTPLVAMLFCYILIFRHIYRTKYNLYIFNDSDPFRLRKTWVETLRTSRMLLGIFVVFLVCWVPYGIVIVFDFYQKLSVELHLFFTMLAHLHSSANCIVYITTNRSFRQVVLNRLGCGWFALSGSESGTKSTKVAKVSHVHTNSSSPTMSDRSPRSTSE